MKRLIVLIMTSLILTSCSNTVPTVTNNNPLPKVTPTETYSKQSQKPTPQKNEKTFTENELAHEAYENAMRKGQLNYIRKFSMEYSFYDINNDGIDEFIAYPGSGACTYSIYNFFKGKINELMAIGQAGNFTIYPEKSAFSFINSGHMGQYLDVFYQITNGKADVVAEHDFTETYNNDKLISTEHKYTVNNEVTTKTKYEKFIENLATGQLVKHENLQWNQWVSPENSEYNVSSVLQSNETEIHYFRFDSNANNSISFRFNVDQNDAKLQNMKITSCDLDLKPISKTDSFGTFEQMDYKCTISEEGGYYLKTISEFKKSNNDDYLNYEVYNSTT